MIRFMFNRPLAFVPLCSRKRSNEWDDEWDDEEEGYSPTSWERDPDESDDDYYDRMQDQEDMMDSWND